MTTNYFSLNIKPEETFSLAGKQIKFNSAKDIEKYCDEIKQFSHLRKIDLSGNTIGIDASEALSKAIIVNGAEIEEINFSDIYTGRLNTEIPRSLGFLLPALLKLPNLKVLNLSDNAFGLQTIDPIEQYLPNAVSLEHLILSNNGMGPFAGARIGKALFKLAHNKKAHNSIDLRSFVCGRNRLENGSLNYLSLGLKQHKNLEVIRLYQNGIRPRGIDRLVSHGLSHLPKLTTIDLQDNTITSKSTKIIADNLIHNWKDLQELNLNDSLLQKKGGFEILDALLSSDVASFPNLKFLKLQFNELNECSLEILPKLIEKKLPNLELLEINGNIFDEESNHIIKINEIFDSRGIGELDVLDELEEPDSDEDEDDDDYDDDYDEENDQITEFDPQAATEELMKEIKTDEQEEELVEKLEKVEIK